MPRKIKPRATLTQLEAERQSKIIMGEQAEELDAIGQDSELKGAKWAIEKEKERTQQEKQIAAAQREILEGSKKKVFTYRDSLLRYAQKQIVQYDIPQSFLFTTALTQKGLLIGIRDPKNKWYVKGLQIVGEPKYDINWIDRTVIRGLDQMDQIQDIEKRSKGGIIIS